MCILKIDALRLVERRSEKFIECTYCRFYCLIKLSYDVCQDDLGAVFDTAVKTTKHIKANPLKLRLIDLLGEDLGSKPIFVPGKRCGG